MQWFAAYPVATISCIGFYGILMFLAIPQTRKYVTPLFIHPIPPHQRYLKGFDTLRGFAAIFVAISHSWWSTYPVFSKTQLSAVGGFIAYGAKAVPMFAVLSGFLIYRSTLSISTLNHLREYALRRFFRIYPVYFFGVLLCLLQTQYQANASELLTADILMFTILDWPGGFANPATWSLYIEVMFYAFVPFFTLVLNRRTVVILASLGIIAMIVADCPSRIFALWKYFLFGILASELSTIFSKAAAPAFLTGVCLLIIDLQGPECDWAAKMGIGILHDDGSTLALGLACFLMLASLPHLDSAAKALNMLPLRFLGVISYSVYIIQFFYIKANFPIINLFTELGNDPMYQKFKQFPVMPGWYLPLIFLPGLLFWGSMCFLLIERPGIRFGQALIKRQKFRSTALG